MFNNKRAQLYMVSGAIAMFFGIVLVFLALFRWLATWLLPVDLEIYVPFVIMVVGFLSILAAPKNTKAMAGDYEAKGKRSKLFIIAGLMVFGVGLLQFGDARGWWLASPFVSWGWLAWFAQGWFIQSWILGFIGLAWFLRLLREPNQHVAT